MSHKFILKNYDPYAGINYRLKCVILILILVLYLRLTCNAEGPGDQAGACPQGGLKVMLSESHVRKNVLKVITPME